MEQALVPKGEFLVRLKHPDRTSKNNCINGSEYNLLATAVEKIVIAVNASSAKAQVEELNIKCDLCSMPFKIYTTEAIRKIR